MKLIEKWKEKNKEQEAKDIEFCKNHPKSWKLMIIVFILSYGVMSVILVVNNAIPIVIIAIVFGIWLIREMLMLYRKAFPKNATDFLGERL